MSYLAPEPLAAEHITAGFDCGKAPLDRWLTRHALGNEVTGRSRTFVVRRSGDLRVVGFYCLSTTVVQYHDASHRAVQSMPPNEPIPAVLLGRLAVDTKHQGLGLGSGLLDDAVRRTYSDIASNAGVRVMLVHAKDREAQAFYLAHGFEASPSDDLHLMLLMQDVRRLLHLE